MAERREGVCSLPFYVYHCHFVASPFNELYQYHASPLNAQPSQLLGLPDFVQNSYPWSTFMVGRNPNNPNDPKNPKNPNIPNNPNDPDNPDKEQFFCSPNIRC